MRRPLLLSRPCLLDRKRGGWGLENVDKDNEKRALPGKRKGRLGGRQGSVF